MEDFFIHDTGQFYITFALKCKKMNSLPPKHAIIETLLTEIEQAIQNFPFKKNNPRSLYDSMEYMMGLGGKRIRPLLTLLTFHIFREGLADKSNVTPNGYLAVEKPEAMALNLALSVEIFHNFTLMHDDVMDNAPDRRGKPTIHVLKGVNTAILAGDGLFAMGYGYLLKCHPHKRFNEIKDLYQKVVLEVCEGQMMDLEQATIDKISIEEYDEMIRKKTAALIGGAIGLGALAADVPAEIVKECILFGEKIGLSFQLHDDYLDLYGNPHKTGKQTGGDILENKNNFLWIHSLQKANSAQYDELWNARMNEKNSETKIHRIKSIYDQLNLGEALLNEANTMYQSAKQMCSFFPENIYSVAMNDLFESLVHREK